MPAAAQARGGRPRPRFGRRGTVTLKATAADAVGGAVKVISGNRVLAGGAAAGQFVRRPAALDRHAGQQVRHRRPGRPRAARARRWTACARSRSFRDGRIVAAGHAAAGRRHDALRRAPAAADGRDRPELRRRLRLRARRPGRRRARRDGDGPQRQRHPRPARAPGDVPIVDPAAGRRQPGPDVRRQRHASTARCSASPAASPACSSRADGHDRPSPSAAARRTIRRPSPSSASRPTGALDPTFGAAPASSTSRSGPGSGAGIGAAAIRQGPSGTTLVAGTDLTDAGTPRGAVIRLSAGRHAGHPLRQPAASPRLARAGREIRIKAMVRDSTGRILLAGSGQPPDAHGHAPARQRRAATRPSATAASPTRCSAARPAATRSTRRFDAIDAAGSRAVIAGSAAGPGQLIRGGAPARSTPAASRSPSRDCE